MGKGKKKKSESVWARRPSRRKILMNQTPGEFILLFRPSGLHGEQPSVRSWGVLPPFSRACCNLAPVKVLFWLLLTGPLSCYCTFTTLSIQKDSWECFWQCFWLCWKAKIVLSAIILQCFMSSVLRVHFCAVLLFQLSFELVSLRFKYVHMLIYKDKWRILLHFTVKHLSFLVQAIYDKATVKKGRINKNKASVSLDRNFLLISLRLGIKGILQRAFSFEILIILCASLQNYL